MTQSAQECLPSQQVELGSQLWQVQEKMKLAECCQNFITHEPLARFLLFFLILKNFLA